MDLCKQELCTGCLACFNICPKEAIKLEQDKEGFVYPQIDQSLCINCGQCQSVCPIINFKSKKKYSNKSLCCMAKGQAYSLQQLIWRSVFRNSRKCFK